LSHIIVAVDAMGGDGGASVTVPGVLKAIQTNPDLHVMLVGQKEVLSRELAKFENVARLEIVDCDDLVAMDESPAHALRYKKNSSMRVAIDLVEQGKAQACVSSGNTGALMAISRHVLKTLPGISRPALVNPIPGVESITFMLDLGANIDCQPDQLVQFAVMGSVLASAVANVTNPRVGLLNIGSESIKGPEVVRKTAELLSEQTEINYVGYVEGNNLLNNNCDVLVCDGFSGNVALKTCEGVASTMLRLMKQAFNNGIFTKLVGFFVSKILKKLPLSFNPSKYNGATLIGLRGIVIKSHGSADDLAFASAIDVAIVEVKHDVPKTISKRLETMLVENEA